MRNFVWSDEEVQKVASNFVCVTEECFDLTPPDWLGWVSNPESTRLFLTFQKSAKNLIPKRSQTSQGTYLMTGTGEYIDGDHAFHRRDEMVRTLSRAWHRFEKMAEERGWQPKPIPTTKLDPSLGNAPQKGSLKLAVNSRDLPRGNNMRPGQNEPDRAAWNGNWLDFSAEEVRTLIPRGDSAEVPQSVLTKLAIEALQDNVRGQTGWKPGALKDGRLKVQEISRDGQRIQLRYSGFANLAEEERSFDAKLYGRAVYLEDQDLFEQFEMLAVGQRVGGSQTNRRENDPGPAPLGISLQLHRGSGNPSQTGRKPQI